MPGSDTYFLEVSANVSPKVATNNSFRDKETKKVGFFLINLECSCLVQIRGECTRFTESSRQRLF